MDHSMRSIDRTTHLKIVALALLSATAVVGLTLAIHSNSKVASFEDRFVIKARPPTTASGSAAIAR
jgi:hypothetical protein